jgi:hypothetical protein
MEFAAAISVIAGMVLVTTTIVSAILVVSSVVNGFVLTKLWAWFIVPMFHLPELGLPQAIALALVVGWLTYSPRTRKPEKDEWKSGLTIFITRPLIALAFGGVLHYYWF